MRKAATTIDTATAEEDAKDFNCACASSRTCLQRVFSKSVWSSGRMSTALIVPAIRHAH